MRTGLAAGTVTPEWCGKVLAPYGRNPLGEPLYRVVFATRRVSLLGGYWEENGSFRYALKPRYPKRKCWVLEKWIHARHYGSPATWTEQTITADGYLAIGPYPLRGVYECCFLFEHTPLRPDTLLDVVRSIFIGRARSVSDIRQQLTLEAMKEEQELDAEFERRWDETHGVRRGLSFNASGVLTDNEAVEKYKERLAAASRKVKREDFQSGFFQGELNA